MGDVDPSKSSMLMVNCPAVGAPPVLENTHVASTTGPLNAVVATIPAYKYGLALLKEDIELRDVFGVHATAPPLPENEPGALE
jgi:hypothetical protein